MHTKSYCRSSARILKFQSTSSTKRWSFDSAAIPKVIVSSTKSILRFQFHCSSNKQKRVQRVLWSHQVGDHTTIQLNPWPSSEHLCNRNCMAILQVDTFRIEQLNSSPQRVPAPTRPKECEPTARPLVLPYELLIWRKIHSLVAYWLSCRRDERTISNRGWRFTIHSTVDSRIRQHRKRSKAIASDQFW